MTHILLLILKVIGILLLAILGILLFLLLAVLFVPVRYRLEGAWREEPRVIGKVHWFLHLLSLTGTYTKDGLVWNLRILGFKLWRKKKKDPAEAVKDGAETIVRQEEERQSEELLKDEAAYRRNRDMEGAGETVDPVRAGGEESISPDKVKGTGEDANRRPDSLDEEPDADTRSIHDKKEQKKPHGEKPGFWERTAARVSAARDRIRKGILGLWRRLEGAGGFLKDKKAWLEDEKNQASIRLLIRQTRRLLAHIWPGKGRCDITFGFDDPYTTGQVLEAASLIYPFYHRQLSLRPVFEQKILEVEGSLKGRVRLSVILWLAVQIYLDKHTRKMLRGFIK